MQNPGSACLQRSLSEGGRARPSIIPGPAGRGDSAVAGGRVPGRKGGGGSPTEGGGKALEERAFGQALRRGRVPQGRWGERLSRGVEGSGGGWAEKKKARRLAKPGWALARSRREGHPLVGELLLWDTAAKGTPSCFCRSPQGDLNWAF